MVTYSFIIPTLNEEKLLPGLLHQLSGIKNSSHFNYEIIISDGGSTDNTLAIAKEFNVKIVRSENGKENIARGRNRGATAALGELFIFINADIRFQNLTEFVDYLDKQFAPSEFAALACTVKTFPEESLLSDLIFHTFYNFYFMLLNRLGVGMGRGECQVVKRKAFELVEGYNTELAAGEDFDLFRRIRKIQKIIFNANIVVYESPRRYRKIGYWGVAFSWTKNAVSILLKNRSISKVWEQVR